MSPLRSPFVLLGFAGVIALAPAAAAQSKPEILTTITLEGVASALKTAGYRAEIMTTGSPRVRTTMSGYSVAIYLYSCNAQRCGSIQFYAGFEKEPKFTPRFVNQWNREKRYAKAYLDKDSDLAFEYDLQLDGGVTPDFLKEQMSLFERLLSQLAKFEPEGAQDGGGAGSQNEPKSRDRSPR